MRIIRSLTELSGSIRRAKRLGRTIGLVPTMGALHEGHRSLIRKARRENDLVVVSLFVNPAQFDRPQELRSYPRPFKNDAHLARRAGTDILFAPSARSLYPADFQTWVEVESLSRPWEGTFRPRHFRGVTTVVSKLFHLVQPDTAYFGRKDAQQARIVEQMIRDLNFPIRLRILPTARESNGLAMSSRNAHLSAPARRRAAKIFEALQEGRRLIEWGHRRGKAVSRRMKGILRKIPDAQVEYAAVVDPKSFREMGRIRKPALILVAVWIEKTRLIDCCWVG